MNTKSAITILFVTLISSACTTPQQAKQSPMQNQYSAIQTESTKSASPAKKHKHRMPSQVNGVISLDIVSKGGRLHLLTGTHNNGVKSLWYQYSDDQGNSWSKASHANAHTNQKIVMLRGNDAKLSVQGNTVVVVWTSFVKGNMHGAGPMMAARSNDLGKSWQTGATPSDWTEGSNAFLAMSSDEQKMHMVWLDSRFGKSAVKGSQGLRYAVSDDAGLSWSKNITLDNITCACCWNTAKVADDGELFVLYRDKQPTDMAIGSLNKNQQWQRHSPVGDFKWDFPGCPHIGGGLAMIGQGDNMEMHSVVGTGHPDHLGVHYLYSADAGKNWQSPVQLGDYSAIHADIAANDQGRIVAVWDMRSEDNLTIFSAESNDKGKNWSKPKLISTPGYRATHPRIVNTSQGFLVLWTQVKQGQEQQLAMQHL